MAPWDEDMTGQSPPPIIWKQSDVGVVTLVLDEPMSGLDANGRERILELLRETADNGATICLVEHSIDLMTRVCTRIVFLADGSLVREGPTKDIVEDRELASMYFGG